MQGVSLRMWNSLPYARYYHYHKIFIFAVFSASSWIRLWNCLFNHIIVKCLKVVNFGIMFFCEWWITCGNHVVIIFLLSLKCCRCFVVDRRNTAIKFNNVSHRWTMLSQFYFIFYRAAWNADAVSRWENCLSVCPSVRLSIRLSVKLVDCDKMQERSVKIFTPYERPFRSVFWEEERLVEATPSIWNFGSFIWNEIADFEPIFAHSDTAVTPSEKKLN